jgi:hypothetical protein
VRIHLLNSGQLEKANQTFIFDHKRSFERNECGTEPSAPYIIAAAKVSNWGDRANIYCANTYHANMCVDSLTLSLIRVGTQTAVAEFQSKIIANKSINSGSVCKLDA